MLHRSEFFENIDKPKPEQDLESISFFQLSKSYDLLNIKKHRHLQHAEFTRWSDKEQQFFGFGFQDRMEQENRKKSADLKAKRTSHQRSRFNHSVTFQPSKIDLGSKVSESIHKYQFRTKSKSMFLPGTHQKPHSEVKNLIENISHALEHKKQKRDEMVKRREKLFQDNPEKLSQLETQPSYNFINFPISTMIRKRKYKKMEKFPFPSLAYRLNK